ncbi:MAG TPA: FoF1 ATP synthase subunit gamma [Acidobacteriaceae bacterium]|nr:FoF1 ATP synthase subunit gamma [Acidobacteriaceae bacterium]
MANVLDLRRRIRSVKNTRQITKAMKMVAAAKLRRSQERAFAARPYARMISSVLASLVRRVDIYDQDTGEAKHPLLIARPEKRVTVVVVTGDKGFAGPFNANVLKATHRFIDEQSQLDVDLEIVGRKGIGVLRRSYSMVSLAGDEHPAHISRTRTRQARVEITGEHGGMLDKLTFEKAAELAHTLVDRYATRETDAVYLVFNEFQSVIAQRIVVERILPIMEVGKPDIAGVTEMEREEREEMARAAHSAGVSLQAEDTSQADEEASKFGTAQVDYIYEQPPSELMGALLPRYISTQLYHAMLESVAAEQAARMTAMDAATNNASDMIDAYTLTMNRLRQAAITKEIIEIVSGAAAI